MSKKAFKEAKHSIYNFVKTFSKDKSYATNASIRERIITSMKDLHNIGYPIRNINNIKTKHIEALISHWKDKELSTGTIKNRMSDFRFITKAIGKTNMVADANKTYDIPNRSYIPTENKAITDINLDKFKNQYLRASIELQKEFGLRREECIKIIPSKALYTDPEGNKYLKLAPSWTKGKVGRTIPIRNESQIHAIDNAKVVAQGKSLILAKTFIQQRKYYDRVTREQGYYNLHGLRHAYAQRRYKEITGWECPINDGPLRKDLSPSQKELDNQARLWISQELGHSRASITKNYIG